MKCPNCNETLLITERQGIEIDYCPTCRGVWLDKGELDKIVDRSGGKEGSDSGGGSKRDRRRNDDNDDDNGGRGGFLGNLFDF